MNQKLMKKSLITLAVLGAFAGAAQAQAPADVVTLFGSFDAGVRNQGNVNTAGDSRLTMGSAGTYNSNRLGFRGTEDLGGGNYARFWLEAGFNSGTGAMTSTVSQLFDRAAYVGMGGKWGSLDLGRQYSVAFKAIGGYDPFNYKYTGIIPLAGASVGSQALGSPTTAPASVAALGATRFNNDIQYAGTFGPVTVRAEYALGEQLGSRTRGAAEAVGVTYAAGPISVGGAYSEQRPNAGTVALPNFQLYRKQSTIGGAFKAGPFRAVLGYIDDKVSGTTGGEAKTRNVWGGGSFTVSPAVEATLAVYETKDSGALAAGKQTLYIAGVTYGFSKRTNFYADIDQKKFTGARIPFPGRDKQNGLSVGINHNF